MPAVVRLFYASAIARRMLVANGLAEQAVYCEPVSTGKFPGNREKYRQFAGFRRSPHSKSSFLPRGIGHFGQHSLVSITGKFPAPSREGNSDSREYVWVSNVASGCAARPASVAGSSRTVVRQCQRLRKFREFDSEASCHHGKGGRDFRSKCPGHCPRIGAFLRPCEA
jgi:hypothetical protein